ncbi:MAG: transposase [Pseudomonadota bacterium]|nr:transposase [Pseudomonadota bacterium]
MRYRRNYVEGGTYFFTVNLQNRQSTLLIDHIDLVKHSVSAVKARFPFHIEAAVIMPDHLHMIWTLPEEDADFSTRWRLIKRRFSDGCSKRIQLKGSIWQRRFWEHQIRDSSDLENHINYIHYNPVKHGYVATPSNWRHSSIHKYIGANIIPSNWGCSAQTEQSLTYGERQH